MNQTWKSIILTLYMVGVFALALVLLSVLPSVMMEINSTICEAEKVNRTEVRADVFTVLQSDHGGYSEVELARITGYSSVCIDAALLDLKKDGRVVMRDTGLGGDMWRTVPNTTGDSQ